MAFFTDKDQFKKAGLLVKGASVKAPYQDPTYLGFLLLFMWNNATPSGLGSKTLSLADYGVMSPLFDESGAERYLRRLAAVNSSKYQPKLDALINFKTALKKINQDMPWYWQTLGGFDKTQAYNVDEPYQGGDDAKIAIGCLESINLAITHLMALYREAVFDTETWSYVIPRNLRKFAIQIYVQDIRPLYNQNPNTLENDPDLMTEETRPYISVMLTHCEFDIQSSGIQPLGELNNATPEAASQLITFSYERILKVKMNGLNGIITPAMMQKDVAAPVDSRIPEKKTMWDKVKDRLKDDMKKLADKKKDEAITAAANLVRDTTGIPFSMDGMKPKLELEGIYMNATQSLDRAATSALNFGSAQAAKLLMGNVYLQQGYSIQDTINAGLQKALGNVYSE